jgi:hypothetical protein
MSIAKFQRWVWLLLVRSLVKATKGANSHKSKGPKWIETDSHMLIIIKIWREPSIRSASDKMSRILFFYLLYPVNEAWLRRHKYLYRTLLLSVINTLPKEYSDDINVWFAAFLDLSRKRQEIRQSIITVERILKYLIVSTTFTRQTANTHS